MKFAKVFPLLIAKAERKGRTRDEVFKVTMWLLGYTKEELEALLELTPNRAQSSSLELPRCEGRRPKGQLIYSEI